MRYTVEVTEETVTTWVLDAPSEEVAALAAERLVLMAAPPVEVRKNITDIEARSGDIND